MTVQPLLWLGHATDLHDEGTTTAEHLLLEPGSIFILWVVVSAAVWFGLRNVTPPTRLNILLFVALVVGIIGYRYAPLVSAAAITLGFIAALAQMVFGSSRGD
jgi:hypothetical protein